MNKTNGLIKLPRLAGAVLPAVVSCAACAAVTYATTALIGHNVWCDILLCVIVLAYCSLSLLLEELSVKSGFSRIFAVIFAFCPSLLLSAGLALTAYVQNESGQSDIFGVFLYLIYGVVAFAASACALLFRCIYRLILRVVTKAGAKRNDGDNA